MEPSYKSFPQPQGPSQREHLEMASSMANQILSMPLDIQNDMLIHIYGIVKNARGEELSDLNERAIQIKERKDTVISMNERLSKEMEAVRVG